MARLAYQVVTTAHGQTGFVQLGSGSPLIMLVGYSGNLLHWNSQLIYRLAEHYTVYLPDNRQVGQTHSTNPPSMAGLAADTFDFMDSLNLSSARVVGWSMGGIIAQAMAYHHQARLSGLALIVSQPDYSYTLGRLHQLVSRLREEPSKANRDELTSLFFSEMPSVDFRKYLAKAILPIEHYVYPFNATAQALQDQAVTSWQMDRQQLQQLTVPTLVTVAKNDLITQPQASYDLHQLLANSKLISYPDGGHFFLHHYPQELAQQIISFLG